MTDEWYVIYFVHLATTQPRPGLRVLPSGKDSTQGTETPRQL